MAAPVVDTMTIANVAYESNVLTMDITTGYSMENADFTISHNGTVVASFTRSGYLANPYSLSYSTAALSDGETYTLDASYMDGADSGTSCSASATFTIPAVLVPTADLSVRANSTTVQMTATSTTPGAGDLRIYYSLYSNSSMTDHVTSNHPAGGILLADGGSYTWNRNYVISGGVTFEPGHTYYVKLANYADDSVLATGQFTVPHYTTKVFKEWQRNGVAFNFSTPVTEDITLVGAWNEVYQVTFKDYDDSVISTQNVVQGSATSLIMPPDPTRSGYTFAGWECSLDGHIWNNATEDVISEMTLKATYTTT